MIRHVPLAVLAGLFCFGSASHAAQVGDSRETVVAEKGAPISSVASASKSILYFQDGTAVTFSSGKVTQISQQPPREHHESVAAPTSAPATPVARSTAPATRTSFLHAEKSPLFISIGVGVIVGLALFRVFFSNPAEFFLSMFFFLLPRWLSFFRNRNAGESGSMVKFGLWFVLSAGAGFCFYYRNGLH